MCLDDLKAELLDALATNDESGQLADALTQLVYSLKRKEAGDLAGLGAEAMLNFVVEALGDKALNELRDLRRLADRL